MADYAEFWVDQGADFISTLSISDDITNQNSNIASYTFVSQMRRSYYSKNATANIVCTVVDSANGQLAMTLSSAVTANIKPNRYVFDVKAIDANNAATRILEGIITITPGVTR